MTTGHADGVVTIDMAEGDNAHREAVRARLAEPYRTLLGHFRHETGHYYWEGLANTAAHRAEVQEVFGDDTADYQAAIDRHYEQGAPDGWEDEYVSAYATMHPWEDWAETFAHYLHIRDTVQTASSYGVWIGGPDVAVRTTEDAPLAALPTDAPPDIEEVMREWVPLVLTLNAINRSMGKDRAKRGAYAQKSVRGHPDASVERM